MLARKAPQQESASVATSAVGPAVEPPCANSEVGLGDVEAMHDTRSHVGVGNSVAGTGIEVKGIVFTPGEAAALVDFVGPLTNLEKLFTVGQLAMIKGLVERGIEDSEAWDLATGGQYTLLAQENENHFGEKGFGTDFVSAFALGLQTAQAAQRFEEGSPDYEQAMNLARTHGYTAEHFLQDAFSAGHQVESSDIADRVAEVFHWADATWMFQAIGREVWARGSDIISCYAFTVPGLEPNRIDTEAEFLSVAVSGGIRKGEDGMADGVRKFVHEELGRSGVEVASKAHPTPWVLKGDHDLREDEVGTLALQQALSEVRTALELAVPGTDPDKEAKRLFELHCPRPTPGDGQAMVAETLARATASPLALAASVATATVETLVGVMNGVVSASKGAITRVEDLPEEKPLEPSSPFEKFPGTEPGREPEVGDPVHLDPVEGPAQPIESEPTRPWPPERSERPGRRPEHRRPRDGRRHRRPHTD